MKLKPIKRGDRGEAVKAFQRALGRRLKARDLAAWAPKVDGDCGPQTMAAAKKAAWALGALEDTYKGIRKHGVVPVGVVRMVLNPGKRTDAQLARAHRRMAALRKLRKDRAKEHAAASGLRRKIVSNAANAAAHYRTDPGAYHYLAGGIANLIYLEPSPLNFRSDCSQFASSCYADADAPSPATVEHKWASTYTMAAAVKAGKARVVDRAHRRPGDLGMYGTLDAPHHVELCCLLPGQEFIGHGSPPIDSLTPGQPDYYITFDWLD